MPVWAKGGEFSPMASDEPSTLRWLRSPASTLALVLAAVLAVVATVLLLRGASAQVEGDRGIAAVVASSDIDIGGIEVDVTGDSAEDAREKGWREAQRLAWAKAGGSAISDGQLQGLVSAIVIEREQISPRRYVARLGVIFDRQRAGGLLGQGGARARSAPMLLLPVTLSGGTATMYERRNPWQRAWAEYQAGASRVDYVRPSGAGGESLLLTYGQTQRRSRLWWRGILDQFEAADVLVPIADLTWTYPGGPIEGRFTARYGPDNEYLDSFALNAPGPQALDDMLRDAVGRFDRIFAQALADGKLRPDPTLQLGPAQVDPVLARLIELGRQAEAGDRARAAAQRAAAQAAAEGADAQPQATSTPVPQAAQVGTYVVQFASPDTRAFDGTLQAVRATPGVRGAGISSTAIGGTSVMSVTYAGSLAELAAALRGRGFTVTQGATALAISR